jgi:hypothetical protein
MNVQFIGKVCDRLRELEDARELSQAASVLGAMGAGCRKNGARSKPKRWTGFLADNTPGDSEPSPEVG